MGNPEYYIRIKLEFDETWNLIQENRLFEETSSAKKKLPTQHMFFVLLQ